MAAAGRVPVGGVFTEHPEVLRSEHSEQEVDVMFRRQQAAQRGGGSGLVRCDLDCNTVLPHQDGLSFSFLFCWSNSPPSPTNTLDNPEAAAAASHLSCWYFLLPLEGQVQQRLLFYILVSEIQTVTSMKAFYSSFHNKSLSEQQRLVPANRLLNPLGCWPTCRCFYTDQMRLGKPPSSPPGGLIIAARLSAPEWKLAQLK